VPGCIARGIDERVANKIFDDMTDFAKYAFNKSHAAAYTIVSYQTAWLKYYYPVEFMAALMTSVIDFPNKVAEYIMECRKMDVQILPPDINEGERDFSVSDGNIRYALSAIKSVGRSVIDGIVKEREAHGIFVSLKDFIERMLGKDVNKRTVESFIKSGAMDSLHATRRQLMMVYAQVMDQVTQERKKSMTGQLSLFDFVSDEDKAEFDVHYPKVGEYDKELKLAFEKEVLGIYISGHPLEEYEKLLLKNVTAVTTDFYVDDETGSTRVRDNQNVIIGGMITSKTVKVTKNNKLMAFISLEDLVGVVEVIVFPNDYERHQKYLEEDQKVYIRGRVSASEDQQAKLICERIIPFDELPKEIWIKFDNKDVYMQREAELYRMLEPESGNDRIVIFCAREKAVKRLENRYAVQGDGRVLEMLREAFGGENVKLQQSVLKR
jgi:DNA polymerase-3 subunit alpha